MKKILYGFLVLGFVGFVQPSYAIERHTPLTACERKVIHAAFVAAHRYEPLVRPALQEVFQFEPGLYRVTVTVFPGEIIADVRVNQNCEILSVEATDTTNYLNGGG